MIKQICFLLVLLGGYSVSMMAADKKEVYIARTESTVTIGNEYLSREFSLADGKVRTRVIENKRTGSEAIRILPEVASEAYVNCGFAGFGYLFFRSFIAGNTGCGRRERR